MRSLECLTSLDFIAMVKSYGVVWLLGSPTCESNGERAVRALWATSSTPPHVTILMDLSDIKHTRLT